MRRTSIIRIVFFTIAIVLLAYLAHFASGQVSIDRFATHEDNLRSVIDNDFARSFGIGLGIYTLVSLVPGTSGKALVAGWLFGLASGTAMVLVGLTIAGMVEFHLSRSVLRRFVEKRFHRFVSYLNHHLERDGTFYLLTARMAMVPYTLINMTAGASAVRAWSFIWTTFVGLAPTTLIFVYAGTQVPTLRELADEGAGAALGPDFILSLALVAISPVVMRWIIRRLRRTRSKLINTDPPLNRTL